MNKLGDLNSERPTIQKQRSIIQKQSTSYQNGCPATSDRRQRSVDDALSNVGCGAFQVIAFLLAGITSFAFMSEAISYSLINLQISSEWKLSELAYAALPALSSAANILGGFFYGYLCDTYGRVWPYAVASFMVGSFVLASGVSPTFITLIILRCLASLSTGGVLGMIYPMYLEFLPAKNRGQAGVMLMIMQSLGACYVSGLAWLLLPMFPQNGWRYLVGASSIPFLITFLFRMIFSFESPRFLVVTGKVTQAWKTLNAMSAINCRKNALTENEDELRAIGISNKSIWLVTLQIFSRKYFVQTMSILIVNAAFMTSYIGTTLFFPVLLKNLGVNPYAGMFIGFTAQIPGVLLMAIIIEWPWFGRLNSLRLFMALSAIFLFLFAFVQNEVSIPLFTVFLYFSFSPLMPLIELYTSECYPTQIRAMVSAILHCAVFIVNMAIPFCGGFLADLSVHYPWLSPTVWGSVMVFALLASCGLRVETRGRNLKESFET